MEKIIKEISFSCSISSLDLWTIIIISCCINERLYIYEEKVFIFLHMYVEVRSESTIIEFLLREIKIFLLFFPIIYILLFQRYYRKFIYRDKAIAFSILRN